MNQISVQEITAKARQFKEQNKKWHFHLLTPECSLNKIGSFPLILEDNTDNEIYTRDFQEKPMEIGKELLEILHGETILQEEPLKTETSESVRQILKRAKELSAQGIFWHHHLLFPDCIFNKNKGKWTLMLEDPKSGEVLESVTDNEPKEDLKQVETLFYEQ